MTDSGGMDLATFHDVDTSPDPAALIRFLDLAKGHPVLVDLQQRLIAELRLTSGARVLDAGCGPGTQAFEIAGRRPRTTVVGVDASRVMIGEARRRAAGVSLDVRFDVADAAALPFPAGTFDAVQAQTLLEHVDDAGAVLAELRRVTRPGGRIAALDLDNDSTVLDHPDPITTRSVLAAWSDDFAGGRTARALHRLFREAGLVDVTVEVRAAEFGAGFMRALMAPALVRVVREGRLDSGLVDAWWAGFEERAAGGSFVAASLWFLVAGTVPA